MKSVLVIDGHPDPDTNHLCHALANAYAAGAEAGGHQATVLRVANLDFPILRRPSDFENEPTPVSLRPARDALLAADHVVLIYPLWLGTLPALTKAFLEQVLHHDTAFEQAAEDAWPKGKLQGKSARIVVTMGMPTFAYRFWFGAHSLKNLERNILKFVGFKPVRDTLFGMVGQASADQVDRWLLKMETLGRGAL